VDEISDQYMREHMAKARSYALVLLSAGERYGKDGSDAIVFEHGRRNFALRAEGLLSIVCPVTDDSSLCGIGIFNMTVDGARQLMEDDPGVRAGVFTFEVHPVRSFPGDTLPVPE
jgi:hypothetical protein